MPRRPPGTASRFSSCPPCHTRSCDDSGLSLSLFEDASCCGEAGRQNRIKVLDWPSDLWKGACNLPNIFSAEGRTTMRPRNLRFLAALLGIFLLALAWTAQYRAAIEGINWFPIGPAPGHFGSFPGGISGRATAVAANPANVNDIWLGTSQGGVWHSTDGGSTWAPKSDDQPSLAIGSLALAGCGVNGCTSIYAGTGENAIRRDTFYGKGLLVGSRDRPDVFWSNKTGTPYSFKHGSIYNVVLDPTTSGSGQIIYVTLSSGVTASASESTVTAPEPAPGGDGVDKTTPDRNSRGKPTLPRAARDPPPQPEAHPPHNKGLYPRVPC